jgi:hypothetical protein
MRASDGINSVLLGEEKKVSFLERGRMMVL